MVPPENTRAYSSTLRASQAAATREKVVEAASELFSQRGFAATTMPEIARRAGVSTETVQAHGPKQALLRAAIDAATFGGDAETDARETELGTLMLSASSAEDAAAAAAFVLTRINESVHGLWLSLAEAARHDASSADALSKLAEGIRLQNTTLMSEWRDRGYLREDVLFDELVVRAMLLGSVEVYDRAVRVGGIPVDDYTRTLAALLVDALTKR